MENNKIIQKSTSFIIPLHNEENFLVAQINKLIKIIKKLNLEKYEIILIENGSTDKTLKLVKGLAQKNKKIKLISLPFANYGEAIRKGIIQSKNNLIIQLDLDFIDYHFIQKAIKNFDSYTILVGSKHIKESRDQRSILRKIMSKTLLFILKYVFKYPGTDTHGIKAYKKDIIKKLIQEVPLTQHLFDTSIIIYSYNLGYEIKETPVKIKEIRISRFPSFLRIIQACYELIKLLTWKISNANKFSYQPKYQLSIPII